jgi:hypothetical protein
MYKLSCRNQSRPLLLTVRLGSIALRVSRLRRDVLIMRVSLWGRLKRLLYRRGGGALSVLHLVAASTKASTLAFYQTRAGGRNIPSSAIAPSPLAPRRDCTIA